MNRERNRSSSGDPFRSGIETIIVLNCGRPMRGERLQRFGRLHRDHYPQILEKRRGLSLLLGEEGIDGPIRQ